MNEIWISRLVAGTKTWAEVPDTRKNAIKAILSGHVENEVITPEQYMKITGEKYTLYLA